MADLGRGGAAFAAYVDGRKVVDVWGGQAAEGEPWNGDTTSLMMSTTKGVATICAALLVDRGQLDVDAPVSDYWPEFAANGKERVLVHHVLTHTSGVIALGDDPPLLSPGSPGWADYDGIAAALARSRAWWEPGTKVGYHAFTYGWIVGELVRRITGRTIGTFLQTELAGPLDLQMWIGTPAGQTPRVATLTTHPARAGRLTGRLTGRLGGRLQRRIQDEMRRPGSPLGRAFLVGEDGVSPVDDLAGNFASASGLQAEIASSNGTATARSIARLYAVLSMEGQLEGLRILKRETVESFRSPRISLPDALLAGVRTGGRRWLLGVPVRRSLGFQLNPRNRGERPRFGPNPNSYGHDGLGGQLGFCDPDARIAVGFLRSDLSPSTAFSSELIRALYRCAGPARHNRILESRNA